MLAHTFDYYLLSYCKIQYCKCELEYITDPKKEEFFLDSEIDAAFHLEMLKSPKRRKTIPQYITLDDSDDIYHSSNFAFHAKQDILCKYLSLTRNAFSKLSSPGFHMHFISPDSLKSDFSTPVVLPKQKIFEIEDYFYYEYFTGMALSIEITAALLESSSESERMLIFSELKKRIKRLVRSPMLLTRISIARCYIMNAQFAICQERECFIPWETMEQRKRSSASILEECVVNAFSQIDPILNSLYDPYSDTTAYFLKEPMSCESILHNWKSPASDTQEQWQIFPISPVCPFDLMNPSEVDMRLKFFIHQLSAFEQPINICEYVCSPQYGPIAFCNTLHTYVKKILRDFTIPPDENNQINICRNRSRYAKLFNQVYKSVQAEIPSGKDALQKIFQ